MDNSEHGVDVIDEGLPEAKDLCLIWMKSIYRDIVFASAE